MDNNRYFPLGFISTAVCVTVGIELCGWWLNAWVSPLGTTAIVRSVQVVCLLALLAAEPRGFFRAGLSKNCWVPGLKAGILWSAGFGVAAGITALLLLWAGQNPVTLVRVPIPADQPLLFIVTAGVIGPVSEEIFFRGVLYPFFRRFGVLVAMGAVTLLFAALHLPFGGLPVVPLIGSLVFCLSFEVSGSLVTPVIIHACGNMALFALTLLAPILFG